MWALLLLAAGPPETARYWRALGVKGDRAQPLLAFCAEHAALSSAPALDARLSALSDLFAPDDVPAPRAAALAARARALFGELAGADGAARHAPTLLSLGPTIVACEEAGEHALAKRLYVDEGVARGLLPVLGRGARHEASLVLGAGAKRAGGLRASTATSETLELDVRGLPSRLAKIAVAVALEGAPALEGSPLPLVIITGRGAKLDGRPDEAITLKRTMAEMLGEGEYAELGVAPDPNNPGRLLIRPERLEAWVRRRRDATQDAGLGGTRS